MDSHTLPPRTMWADAPRSEGEELQGHGGPVAGSTSQALVLDNGSSLVVNEAASTGGSGLYARPMQGVDQHVIEDLSATLTAMHLSRRRDVERAGSNALGGRRTAAIMQENPATAAARSVAVWDRLCHGVSSDAAFQRVRLQRLNGAREQVGAASTPEVDRSLPSRVLTGTHPASSPLEPAFTGTSPMGMPVASEDPPAATNPPSRTPVLRHSVQAAPTTRAPTALPRAEEMLPAVLPLAPTTGADTTAPRSAARHPSELPLARPSNADGEAACSLPSCEPSDLVSRASLPTLKSCREMHEMWEHGKRDSSGIIVCHPLSQLCITAERQKLFPGPLLRADAVRVTRYKRVAKEIADVGGIDAFENKWGSSIVSNVYKRLTTGYSQGGDGKKRRTI